MIKELYQGLQAYRKANRLVFKHRLWPYLIAPGIFSLTYFPVVVFFSYLYIGDVAGFINAHLIPGFLQSKATLYFLTFILWIIVLALAYMAYKYVVLVLCSPILSYLSEITEKIILGTEAPGWSFQAFTHDLLRALIINLRIVIMTLVLMSLAWLTVLIPIAGVIISPVLMFLIQVYYTGCGLVDPTLERRRYSVRNSLKFAKNHRGTMGGLGIGFTLLLMIPFVGWYLAPSYGTIAATIATLEVLSNTTLENTKPKG